MRTRRPWPALSSPDTQHDDTGTHKYGPRIPVWVRRQFATGDALRGSEKLWGAFPNAVTVECQERGWKHGNPQQTIDVGLRLAEEMGIDSAGVWAARSFRANFYHGFLEDFEVEYGRPVVRDFVERILDSREA